MGRFPVCGGVNIYKRGLGIDSVLGLFRRGTKGRIPTWSASWRPFCRVADFLSLTHSLFSLPVRVKLKLGTSPAASPTSIDGVRTSSNWPGTQSPTAHRHLK
ncbi:hypothetical protein ASPTUDRAFT_58004 [Aspergillus tubingensis CBS 134.48]|uniref:Uncharacterized protein n=1 Tax=Aspergillus tubingensis (strain CBS 134.48) TaxID=767770 RepID=A0A1L9MZ58_ASPTC|nr:hypothetical protein ASPTUDRAFT_58004 [Aspergillus tubingensis CBS 134.48]